MAMDGGDRARELEVFRAVADSGSFSAGGRSLGLTPSAMSRTLDRIEQRLGARLVLRTTRALTLTAEGRAYLSAARRIHRSRRSRAGDLRPRFAARPRPGQR